MSAQINLYHPRFLKQRELLTLANVLLAAAAAAASTRVAASRPAHPPASGSPA